MMSISRQLVIVTAEHGNKTAGIVEAQGRDSIVLEPAISVTVDEDGALVTSMPYRQVTVYGPREVALMLESDETERLKLNIEGLSQFVP